MTTKNITTIPSAAIQLYLKSNLPITARVRFWHQLTEDDLAEFKRRTTGRPDSAEQRRIRREIKKCFSKSVNKLTLDEFRDYRKPNFHASDLLKELWPQLTPAEQDLVKQTNEWAFTFPATFDTEEQFLQACASRLERFFGRKFRVRRSKKPAAAKKPFVYISPDITIPVDRRPR